MSIETLLVQLVTAMKAGGHIPEATKLEEQMRHLLHGSKQQKLLAAEFIYSHCHIKAYGDLYLEIAGAGRAPQLDLLSKIRQALKTEVSK